jgi:hypothetical protein
VRRQRDEVSSRQMMRQHVGAQNQISHYTQNKQRNGKSNSQPQHTHP